ncbi:hypothetical protein ABWH96_10255 [Marivirga tractuosa]|uniref:hypothetical protein n=1 Tax=Marivirga tractuosa TaxID=1006 RepID=UPI0035CF68FB
MLGLSFALILAIAPTFYRNAKSQHPSTADVKIVRLSIDYAFDSKDYLGLRLFTSNDQLVKVNLYIPENEHIELISYLAEYGILSMDNWNKQIPLELNKTEILNIGMNLNTKIEDDGQMEWLRANDEYLIGNSPWVRHISLYVLSVVFFIVGLGALLLTIIAFSQTYKTYKETGSFPSLPNSVLSKIKGFKYLVNGFKDMEDNKNEKK